MVVLGSVTSRAGFEGNDAPHAVFPTVVGLVKKAPAYVGLGQKDAYVGEEALGKGDALKLIVRVHFRCPPFSIECSGLSQKA